MLLNTRIQWECGNRLACRECVLKNASVSGFARRSCCPSSLSGPSIFPKLRLRADREIVMKAVSQNWEALQWASAELRADREIVLQAVSQNWEALQYATDELRGDSEILRSANLVA